MRRAPPIQLRRIGLHPASNATGIHLDAALCQNFGEVFVGQWISQVPAHAQNDHLARIVASFEWIGRGHRHESLRYQIEQPIQRTRSEEHTSELQSHLNLVCRLLLEKKKQGTKV